MLSRILVLDCGNSRMKWGLRGPREWLRLGVTPNGDVGALSLRAWQDLPRPARAIGVNVAGEAARVRVEGQLARWCFAEGLAREIMLRPIGRTLYFMPPYVVTDDEFALLVARTREIVDSA